MSEMTTRSSERGSVLRKLLYVLGALVALVVVAYFVLTSAAFFKGVILPKVGAGVNSEVTVADASISPFSQVTLRDLKVTPKGAETLLTIGEVRLRYSLMSLLGGKIVVDELAVDGPAVNVVNNADGTSNLDPLLKATKSTSTSTPASPAAAKPLVLDIKSVTVKNASVKQTVKFKDGGQQVMEIANGQLTLAGLKNDAAAKFDLGADLKLATSSPTNATLAAKLDAHFTINLGADAMPKTVNGALKLLVSQATGAAAELVEGAASLECDMTPVDIRQIALKFQKGAVELGQVRLHGPLDLAKQEGKLDLELSGVDRRLLNLVANTQGLDAILQLCGAPGGMAAYVQGMDFGATALSSTNHIELGAGGKNLAVSGQFHGKSVSVARQGVATPVLDLAAAYNVTVDQVQQNAWLREFTLDASSAQKPLLRGALSKPMKFDWKSGANAVEESALTVTLSGFDLRDYRAFLGTNLVSGVINGTLDLQAKAAGKQLFIKLNAAGADLAAVAGSNRVSGLGFQLDSGLTLNNFQKLQINRTEFKLRHGTTELASASATGNADVKSQDLVLAINARVSLPGLLGLAPAAGTPLTAGTLTFDASLKQENLTLPNSKTAAFARSVEGKLDLANLSGTAGGCQFERYDAAIAFDAVLKNNVSTVRKASGTIKQAGQAAGSFESQAEYDTATGAAKFSLKLAGLNENALRPFLAAAPGRQVVGLCRHQLRADRRLRSRRPIDDQGRLERDQPGHQRPGRPCARDAAGGPVQTRRRAAPAGRRTARLHADPDAHGPREERRASQGHGGFFQDQRHHRRAGPAGRHPRLHALLRPVHGRAGHAGQARVGHRGRQARRRCQRRADRAGAALARLRYQGHDQPPLPARSRGGQLPDRGETRRRQDAGPALPSHAQRRPGQRHRGSPGDA
jgi:hypothetical protein